MDPRGLRGTSNPKLLESISPSNWDFCHKWSPFVLTCRICTPSTVFSSQKCHPFKTNSEQTLPAQELTRTDVNLQVQLYPLERIHLARNVLGFQENRFFFQLGKKLFYSWWFYATPVEQYAQFKLHHATPRFGVKN